MKRKFDVLRLLADGRFRSGEELGAALGVSRAAVWKVLKTLGELGLEVDAVRGRGYRLAYPLEMLEAESIRRAMGAGARRLSRVEVLPEIDSTNAYLLSRIDQGAAHACLAERQTAGRGRRGRTWVSPFATNIYLSLLWRFNIRPAALEGVSLAVAVAVVRALRAAGAAGIGLKWPNDVLWQGRKLAGILLEMAGEATGPVHLVIGVGVNVRMPKGAGVDIDQPWADLHTVAGPVSRNQLAGLLLGNLVDVLTTFEHNGIAPFLDEWTEYDLARDNPVELHLPGRIVKGIARGVDPGGALLLANGGTVERFYSGEVSLRFPAEPQE